MKRVVIDASVVLKWYLLDEEEGQSALSILDGYVSDRVALIAPALLEFEVASGLAIAKRRGRVQDEDVLRAMDGFLGLGIELKPLTRLFPKILEYCGKFNLSAYDASYVALADNQKTLLVTADKRLLNAANKLKFVKRLNEFRD
ncbi:MAG: type II toxin-antitoxin system VapC family toxin [Deltaproteobacteria bacterium]|nr:type II toxin-antitoxin system VapC family toxin [Deltaproteobacteria bacterium]